MKKTLAVILTVIMVAAMSVSVFADNFVPSIEQKTAPKVIEVQDGGKTYVAIVIDGQTGKTAEGAELYDGNGSGTILEFVMVSVAEKSKAPISEITQNITNAEEQIKKAADMGKLDDGLDKDIEKAIDAFYGDAKDKIKVTDLVVSDLFDASLIRDKAKLEQVVAGQKVRFKIKPNFTKNDFFVMLHNTDGNNWEVVNDVEWTDEGYLIVTVDKLSVFAFAVEKNVDLPVDPDGPNSPQTNNADGYKFIYIGIAVLCVAAAAFFFVKSKNSKKAQ